MEWHIFFHIWKWLSVSRSLATVALHNRSTKVQLFFKALTEDYKITKVKVHITLKDSMDQVLHDTCIFDICTYIMLEFQTVSEEDVEKVIRKSPTKSCTLYPIPTWLLKNCLIFLLPVITKYQSIFV